MKPRVAALVAVLFVFAPAVLQAARTRPRTDDRPLPAPSALRVQSLDLGTRIDANNLSMSVTNFGSFAYDLATGSAGLEFPKGSGRTVVFAGGLWVGAQVNGQTRVAISEYSWEYQPGQIISGQADNPTLPEYKVYKLLRQYPSVAERDAALADYTAGAVPHGAPVVSVLPDGSLAITGDQMLWSVYNDADPSAHNHQAGSTLPLGIEVQQTAFAFNRSEPLGNTVYLRFKIVNRGSQVLQDTYLGFWFDPDLGGFTDDVVGCAPSQGLGFCYNGDSFDEQYGNAPPAVGVSLLEGPEQIPGEGRLGATGFSSYVNGTDPASFTATYNALRGRLADGSLPIDPTTGLGTEFMFSGDPVAGTGWIDTQPADKRMLLSTGPVTLQPGQEQTILIAVMVGTGSNRLASITALECTERSARTFAGAGFSGPDPTACTQIEPPCTGRPVDYWTLQCGAGAELSTNQMQAIAQLVDERSMVFAFGSDQRGALCAELAAGDPTNHRAAARREFASLLSTASASDLAVHAPGQPGFRINLAQPVSCPSVPASTLGEAIATAQLGAEGSYQDLNPTHNAPIEGFDWGGDSFGGGVGKSADLFGGPIVDPADFPEVEIRFDHAHPQYAYRYLRRQLPDGSLPSVGRGYVYGGFHQVPFSVWDVTHNVQLDVMFLENVVTTDDGTILGPEFQLATFDSTWSPDDSPNGNREILWVIARPYTGSPLPEIVEFGNPLDGTLPSTYVLWARRFSPDAVFDDGDRFHFTFSIVPSGVDAALLLLDGQPQGDPAVQQAYADIATCLHAINDNNGRGPGCEGPVLPPVANAGNDVIAQCASGGSTSVRLDGSHSIGSDLVYSWFAPGITFDDRTSATPTAQFPLGHTTVTLTVTSNGLFDTDEVEVTIVDTTAPAVSLSLTPNRLWPPNHRLVAIHAAVTAADCDPAPAIILYGIGSSENDSGTGPDDVPGDIQGADLGTADFDFQLRAERADPDTGSGGRTYRVYYQVTDRSNNTRLESADVTVPRDMRAKAALVGTVGSPSVIVYGAPNMSVRGIDRTSLEVGSADFQRIKASSLAPSYGDFDGDHREDAMFVLAGALPPIDVASSTRYVRWLAAGTGYIAEAGPPTTTGVTELLHPTRFEAAVVGNPAHETTVIQYALPRAGRVRVGIFDVAGHRVADLVDGRLPAGRYEARFEASGSQLYFYRVEWEGKVASGKFVVVK